MKILSKEQVQKMEEWGDFPIVATCLALYEREERLRKALKPFAQAGDTLGMGHQGPLDISKFYPPYGEPVQLTFDHLRNASAELKAEENRDEYVK